MFNNWFSEVENTLRCDVSCGVNTTTIANLELPVECPECRVGMRCSQSALIGQGKPTITATNYEWKKLHRTLKKLV